MASERKGEHPTTAYARAVTARKIPAGRLVRLACQRHLDDLKAPPSRGFYFDRDAADYALAFFGFLRHTKGEWAGAAIALDAWQQFIIGAVFGWLRADGTRRFRTAYIEVPRKNGKSTLAAGVGLFLLIADGEAGAEVYSAATKREQARIVFDDAARMVRASPGIRKRVSVLTRNINVPGTASKFEPLARDAKSLDGLNIHGAILDEVHAHPSREIVDVIDTATGARRQPLTFEITTAGFDRNSVCWEHHEYTTQVLEGIFTDAGSDAWFGYIAAIDKGDDWRDPAVWEKANPGFGISVKPDDLERKAAKAQSTPAAANVFRQKHCNEWTEQAERWLDMERWRAGAGAVDAEALAGRDCYAGLDLARVDDLSALVLLFPPEALGEAWQALARFFVPEDNIVERGRRDRVPYPLWRDQEWIQATPGNTTDFRFIQAAILEDAERFNIRELAYDRTFAGELVNNLTDEGVLMVPFGQGFMSLAAPTAELERLVLAGQLRHGGNPVLDWNAANVVVRKDPAGNIKPDKERSRERIDGVAALINALGRAQVAEKPRASLADALKRRGMVAVG